MADNIDINVIPIVRNINIEISHEKGDTGDTGVGIPISGTTGQHLIKSTDTDYDTEWSNVLMADSVQFDVDAVISAHATGKMHWDSDSGTLELGMLGSDVHLQIGQETLIYARNNTGSTIVNGSIVYISSGVGNKPTIALADNSSQATSNIIGLTTEDISNNTEGYITIFGLVRDLDTSSFSAGDTLFLDSTGLVTNTKPSAPLISAKLGVCIYGHPTAGVILVNTQVVPKIVNLSDVDDTDIADGRILAYDSASSTHKYKQGINSTTDNEPTGSDRILNMVSLTQAEYDAGTPVSTTIYIITD